MCNFRNCGNLSPGPDFLHNEGNIGKGGKGIAPGMQVDQIVVATPGQRALSANPERALLETCKPACGIRFGKVPVPSFVILHACLGNEWCSVCESAYCIGQVVMRFALKRVANRERGMLRNRQSVPCGKLRVNITACVIHNQGMILKPHEKALFELTTEWLSDHGARFEARNPS